ncbi:hypothetical protein P4639_14255 [Priestia megaterium]|uniref:hypothetical protein n=1 Tax=Priestia megaterium TaxID=1404 RepID=UPI002E1F5384|nr:hypothetical protein [Priestia megaterium]
MNFIKRFWNAEDREINEWIDRNGLTVISASYGMDANENECILIVYRKDEE